MITIQRLEALSNQGILDELYQSGMITPKVIIALQATLKVNALVATRMKRGLAVKQVATSLRCTPKTIYAYIKMFKR
jgi:hypothetical protein